MKVYYYYGDIRHDDYNELCLWIAANEIYSTEEELMSIIENQIYEVEQDDDNFFEGQG